MAISDRIQAMYTHTSDIYDSVELTGVDTTDIDKNLVNVPNTLKEGYIDIINNGTDTLYNNFPKVSGEGTSLTLNNTYQAPMRNNLKGNTSQTGTPTPTSPIPVNVVSGDNEILINGKNLFTVDNSILAVEGVTSTKIDDNNFSLTASRNWGFTVYKIGKISNFIGKTIYVKMNYTSTNNITNTGMAIIECDETGDSRNVVQTLTFNSNTISGSANITSSLDSKKYLALRLYGAGSIAPNTANYSNVQVSIDSIEDFKPYQGNTYNIDLPVENLFDKDNANILNCTFNNTELVASGNAKTLYVPIVGGKTYTVSKILSARYRVATTQAIPQAGVSTSGYIENNSATNITINADSSAKYLIVYYYLKGTDTLTEQQILDSIQIEEGSKANSFTPYGTTPIELCKIGNYQDYIYKDSDKWYKYGVIGKVVLNGTENNISGWSSFTAKLGIKISDVLNLINISSSATDNVLISNYFEKASSQNILYREDIEGIATTEGNIYIKIDKTTASTSTDFKNWLSTHNTTVYYVLATPTTTQITYQPLIDQLNLLEKAQSKENQTNISQVNNDLPFIISASALKKG